MRLGTMHESERILTTASRKRALEVLISEGQRQGEVNSGEAGVTKRQGDDKILQSAPVGCVCWVSVSVIAVGWLLLVVVRGHLVIRLPNSSGDTSCRVGAPFTEKQVA